jgi:ribosomal protein S18 acetylase RimI-like enzyme
MDMITLTDQNIADEHICCAFADKKCADGYAAKKDWLQAQFADGLVFKKFDIRGKVFIEYIPAENAWYPLDAAGYMLIQCFWVSGQYQGKGYGKALYDACLADVQTKNGIVVITAKKKQPFMSDPKYFQKLGFERCDTAEPYFELWVKRLKAEAPLPQFKPCAKQGECEHKEGLVVYYTNGCPFTEYYVNTELVDVAREKGIPLHVVKIQSRAQAQHHGVPYTNYSVFLNGRFVTQHIIYAKNFDKFIRL